MAISQHLSGASKVVRTAIRRCITGVAVDGSDAPVTGAKISPRFMGSGYAVDVAQPAIADDSGKFSFDNLRPGDYMLWPEKESDGFSINWAGWRGQVDLRRVTVESGGACQEVRLNMGVRGALMRVRAWECAERSCESVQWMRRLTSHCSTSK
jgi:hypothetical protein